MKTGKTFYAVESCQIGRKIYSFKTKKERDLFVKDSINRMALQSSKIDSFFRAKGVYTRWGSVGNC